MKDEAFSPAWLMSATFTPVTPPPPSRTRQNLVASANPRQLPVTAAEKRAVTKSAWELPSAEIDQSMSAYLKSETGLVVNTPQRFDPVAILDKKLNLRV